MEDPEIHILDDIAFEEVKKRLERIRLRIAIILLLVQLAGGYFVLDTSMGHFARGFYGFVAVGIDILAFLLQHRYRTPKPPEAES
jgi:hypothetical protein